MLEESDILHKSNDKVNNVSLYSLQLRNVHKLSWKMYLTVNATNRYHVVIGGLHCVTVNIKTTQFHQPL